MSFWYPDRNDPPSSTKKLVLQYGERRVLCRFPETFEGALQLAREEFAFGVHTSIGLRVDMAMFDPHSTAGQVELTTRSWDLLAEVTGTLFLTVMQTRATAEAQPSPPLQGSTMRIFARQLTGKVTSLRLRTTGTVSDLANALQDREGIPIEQQRWILHGQQLELGRTLADYDVQQDSRIDLVLRLTGGKPVIYLQSPKNLTATVSLVLSQDWSFSAIYPLAPVAQKRDQDHISWTVDVKDNGALLHDIGTATDVSYLYWEALTNLSGVRPCTPVDVDTDEIAPFIPSQPTISPTDSTLLSIAEVPKYLDDALRAMTLNVEARTSFITYWLPPLVQHEHVALRFLPQRAYEQAAKLDVTPAPDIVTRVFMLFRGICADELDEWKATGTEEHFKPEEWKDVVGVDVERASDKSLFRVLEWGGMEVK